MKIIEIEKTTYFEIETIEDGEYFLYIRHSASQWAVRMGEYDYDLSEYLELETKFQEFLTKKNK